MKQLPGSNICIPPLLYLSVY